MKTAKCSGCNESADMVRDRTYYCVKHYRFKQMRQGSRRVYGSAPTKDVLESLASTVISNKMKCPACSRVMNWLLSEGRSTVITLQHDRDGTIRLMCKGCNSRHHLHPGDSFYDLPTDHKRCPQCESVKHLSDFYTLNSGVTTSRCRVCLKSDALKRYYANRTVRQAKHREWLLANREKVKLQRREYQKSNREKLTAQERDRRAQKENGK